MRCRQTYFYVNKDRLPEVLKVVVDVLVPEYREVPHFLGATLIKADHGNRAEVITTSYWDDGLEGSEEVSLRFVDEIHRISGSNPSRKRFDTLYAELRAEGGTFRQDRQAVP
jgi:hypothetical protein